MPRDNLTKIGRDNSKHSDEKAHLEHQNQEQIVHQDASGLGEIEPEPNNTGKSQKSTVNESSGQGKRIFGKVYERRFPNREVENNTHQHC